MINFIKRKIKIISGEFPAVYEACDISPNCNFVYTDRLVLGKWVYIGPNSFIECKGGVEIGDGTIISSYVTILSSNHDYRSTEVIPYGEHDLLKKVAVGKGVWIGYGATVLPGVTIGDGCVIGAGSVLTKSIPEGSVVAGNPARIVSQRANTEWRKLIDEGKFRLRDKLFK